MREPFENFIANPCEETFRALREAFVVSPTYLPVETPMQSLSALFDEGNYTVLLKLAERLMPSCLLSPSIHYFAGKAASALGNTEREQLEVFLYVALRDCLLQSGDGTPARPYLVTQVDDEHFIMAATSRRATMQSVIQHEDGRVFDVLSAEGGNEVWFDITALERRRAQMRQQEPPPGGTR
ncbi:MAG: hypothetical protein PWP23_461 [Candidatus Sumerlaeota bacterium]|nr:hypothetical protein [Candidatus Sumerlaeota bacterium]